MAQYARPYADFARDQMLNEVDSDTDLWMSIDEEVADDGDYVYGDRTYVVQCNLSAVTDPMVNTGHKIKARGYTDGGTQNVQIKIIQQTGLTERAAAVFAFTASVADFEYTLSGAEADSISDYSDLLIEIQPITHNGLRYITQAYLGVPDPPITRLLKPNNLRPAIFAPGRPR